MIAEATPTIGSEGSASASVGKSLEIAGNKLASGIQNTGVAEPQNYAKGLAPSSGTSVQVATKTTVAAVVGRLVGVVLGAVGGEAINGIVNVPAQPAHVCEIEHCAPGTPIIKPADEPGTVKRAD